MFEPGIDSPERLRIQLVEASPAVTPFAHEMRSTQQAQVLGNGRARDRKG